MHRKLLFIIGFLGLTAAALVFVPDEFDGNLFWSTFRSIHPAWIAASIGATFLGYAVRAFRWQALLGPIKRIPFLPLMSATVVGFGAIFTLGRPGEIVRPIWVNRMESVPIVGGATSIVVERVFDLLMVLLLFVAASPWIEAGNDALRILGPSRMWQLAAVVGASLLGFLLVHRYSNRIVGLPAFLGSAIEACRWGLAATSNARGTGVVAAWSVLLWLVHTLQFWLILEGLGLSYPVAAVAMTLVLTSLGSIVQVPGIGGGFQAGFILAATTVLGVRAEIAVAASLMVWFITTVPTVIATGAYMLWRGISIREIRAGAGGLSAS